MQKLNIILWYCNAMEPFTDDWVDVPQAHANYPDRFTKPASSLLEQVTIGTSVKVSNGQERFYVNVTQVDGDVIIGKVDNQLVIERPYNYGDLVQFTKTNVLDVHTKEQLARRAEIIGAMINRGDLAIEDMYAMLFQKNNKNNLRHVPHDTNVPM